METHDDQTTQHVRAALNGDPEEVTWIVERFTPILLAHARLRLQRHLSNVVDPEDLVQEVWTVALRRWDELEPRGRATPTVLRFLSTTLLNTYRRLLRKHLQGKPVREPGGSSALKALPDDTASIVTRTVRNETRDLVVNAIEGLPELDREVLVMRGIEQVENATAASLLGIKPNTVAARYRRALDHLRALVPASVIEDLGGEKG